MNVQQAKTNLSSLLARAERGEEVIVARAGRPVVRLVPVDAVPPRQFGTVPIDLPDDFFFAPLPESELAAWE